MQYLAMSFAQVSDDIHLFWKSFHCVASRNDNLMNPLSTQASGAIIFIYIIHIGLTLFKYDIHAAHKVYSSNIILEQCKT